MKLKYMKDNDDLLTEIDVDFAAESIKIKNYTDNLIDRAFGINEHPTFKDFEDFLEYRSTPLTRTNFREEMDFWGINDPTPWGIARFFNGRVAGDPYYIVYEE